MKQAGRWEMEGEKGGRKGVTEGEGRVEFVG